MLSKLYKSFPEAKILLIWSLASFFAFFQFFLQTAVSVVGPDWARDFHLNNMQLSNLSAAFFYTYAFMQIPVGLLLDRYPPRYILTIAALILAFGNILLSITDSYAIAFLARLLMGIGSAFGFIGLLQICAIYFSPQRFALVVSLSEGLVMGTVSITIALFTLIVSTWTWRYAFFGCGIICILLALATFYCFKSTKDPHHNTEHLSVKTIFMRLKIIFINKQVVLCSIYGFLLFSIVNAFTSLWGITFLTNVYGIDRQDAANVMGMVFVGIAIGGPISGLISKQIDQSRIILILGALFSTIVMSLVIFSPYLPLSLMVLLFLLVGAGCSVYVQCFAVIKNIVPHFVRATALATSNMIIMLGAPILQLLIGALLENHFFGYTDDMNTLYRLSLGIIPLGLFIAFLLALVIKEK